MSNKQETVSIFGAGLVGSLLAVFLARKGYRVTVLERRSDMRKFGTGEGRSINLAISHRGIMALKEVGLDEEVLSIGVPMYNRIIHAVDGGLTKQPYGKEGECIYSISRFDLNKKLMSLAEMEPLVDLRFNQRCQEVIFKTTTSIVQNTLTGELEEIPSDYIFGADGAFSGVRASMQRTDRFNYSQQYIEYAYKELTIPPGADGNWAMEPNGLHIWPRGHFMLIALPNPDHTFTCTLFFPWEGSPSVASIKEGADVKNLFEKWFPDLISLIPQLESHYFEHPDASLVTTNCWPWVLKHTALIGDAAHAILPFYGQGANAGFEDCYELFHLLTEGKTLQDVLPEYQRIRKPNGDAIAQLAIDNFIEMRDLVGKQAFILQKKIEARFHSLFPSKWVPLYSMVTFSNFSYSEAYNRGKVQDALMIDLMAIGVNESQLNSDSYIQSLWKEFIEPKLNQAPWLA